MFKSRKNTKEEEKDEEIQKLIEQLKSVHDTYTMMQYRNWSEMIVGGLHKSTDTAPTNPLFLRAGGNYPKKKTTTGSDTLTQAVADIASAIVKSRPTPSPMLQCHVNIACACRDSILAKPKHKMKFYHSISVSPFK